MNTTTTHSVKVRRNHPSLTAISPPEVTTLLTWNKYLSAQRSNVIVGYTFVPRTVKVAIFKLHKRIVLTNSQYILMHYVYICE